MILLFVERYNSFPHGISRMNEVLINKLQYFKFKTKVIERVAYQKSKIRAFISILNYFYNISLYNYEILYFVCSQTKSSKLILSLTAFILRIRKLKLKVLLHFHRSDISNFENTGINSFKNLNIQLNLIFLSNRLRDNLKKEITTLENYVNISFSVLPNAIFKDVGYKFSNKRDISKKIRIAFISNLCIEKGIKDFFEICSKIKNAVVYKKVEINLYGICINRFNEDKLKYLGKKFQIKYNYYGAYKFEEFPTIIKNNDVVILPTKNEGDPIIVHELLHFQIPFFVNRVGYIDELLGSKFDKFLSLSDKDTYEKSVNKIINNLKKNLITSQIENKKILKKRFEMHNEKILCLFSKK